MKKAVTLFLSAVMATSVSITGYGATTFADINQVPWAGATTYINEAVSLGLMAGEVADGKAIFRPKDKVTLCETTQLTYSLLKKVKNVTTSDTVLTKWKTVMTSYKIPTWAHEAVAYCMENNIISISDLPKFMAANGTSKSALREEVATMLGKGLLVADTTLALGEGRTDFKDNSSIATTAVKYVALLENEDILSGDTDGNFNPKAAINRSEMSVAITKAYKEIKDGTGDTAQSGTFSAFVSTVVGYGSSVIVTINGGKTYTVDANTNLTYKTGAAAKPEALVSGQLITITYSGSIATKVIIQEEGLSSGSGSGSSSGTSSDGLEGVISSVSGSKIRIKGQSKYYYFYNNSLSIKLDGEHLDIDEFIDAADEDSITVVLTLDENDEVTRIVGETVGDTKKGYLYSINSTKLKIKNGSTYTMEDQDDVDVTFDDDTSADVKDLIDAIDDDESIYVEIVLDKDDYVIKIDAETKKDSDEDTDKGYISSLSKTTLRLTKGSSYTIEDEDDLDITLDDKNADYEDLKDAFDGRYKVYVDLVLDSDNNVIEIVAETKKTISSDDEGILDRLSTSSLRIKDGDTYTIEDEDDLDITLDDKNADYDDLKDAYEGKYKIYVEIIVDSDDNVTEIVAETRKSNSSGDEEGILERLSTSSLKIKNGDTYDIEDEDDLDITLNGRSVDYQDLKDDLNDGDRIYVEIVLDSDDYVTEIDAETKDGTEDEGYIDSLSRTRITLRDGKTYYIEDDGDDIDVTLDDDDADFDDLYEKYDNGNHDVYVELVYDSEDNVIEIVAES